MSQMSGELSITSDVFSLEEKAARRAAFSCAWAEGSLAAESVPRIEAWLALLATRLPSASSASVFRRGVGSGDPERVASWNLAAGESVAQMSASAAQGLGTSIPFARSVGRPFHVVARPDGRPDWVIVVECGANQPQELQQAMEELLWGGGWLVAAISESERASDGTIARRSGGAVRVLERASAARDVVSVADALAVGLAEVLPDTLVTVAVWRRNVLSLAGRAGPETDADAVDDVRREQLIRHLLNGPGVARLASLDPAADAADDAVTVFAGALHSDGAPAAGALLCERRSGTFSADELALIQTVANVAAPLVEQSPVTRQAPVTRERRMLVGLFGPVRLKWKIALVALLALVLASLGATGDYQATVEAVVEATPARRLPPPFEGRVGEVYVRVGDVVKRGQLLARMDDGELQQERQRLQAEREKVQQAARAIGAEGGGEAATARQREIESRLVILEERLARTQIASPVDGVVTGGSGPTSARRHVDGTEDLFAVAPLDGLRLGLRVDPADLKLVREGMAGQANLGVEGSAVPFVVKRITGGEGGRELHIEAQPLGSGAGLVPGATAPGHLDASTQKLIWIWWRQLKTRD